MRRIHFVLFAIMMLSGCAGPRALRRCYSAYDSGKHLAMWDTGRAAWRLECRESVRSEREDPVEDAELGRQVKFWFRCAEHFAGAVKKRTVTLQETRAHCMDGRPGAAKLSEKTGISLLPRPAKISVGRDRGENIFEKANAEAGTVLPGDWSRLDAPFDRYVLLISSYAEPADARAALETLRLYPSTLTAVYQATPYGSIKPLKKEGYAVEVSVGYAEDTKSGKIYPFKDYGEGAPLAATRPEHPDRVELDIHGTGKIHPLGPFAHRYPDESVRMVFSDIQATSVFLHELHHLRRWSESIALNRFSDERDAFAVEFRFLTRYQQKTGRLHLPLLPARKSMLFEWQKDPNQAEAFFIEFYAEGGHLAKKGDLTIENEILEQKFPQIKKMLEEEAVIAGRDARLQRDWRRMQEEDFFAYWEDFVAKQRARIRGAGGSRKKRKEELSDLDDLDSQVHENPWAQIPTWDRDAPR